MAVTVPVHADLRELWAARPDRVRVVRRRHGRGVVTALMIWSGMFILGWGVGGALAVITG
jgi:hypothetical protein